MDMDFYPDYYSKFKCIASECSDNCCIGWEIDIDDATYLHYKNCGGEFEKRVAECIRTDEDGVHSFILDEHERCPFLNDKNLCDVYINLGSDALGNICTDHPRFRNFLSFGTETGIGLCCEAAAEIILGRRGEFSLDRPEPQSEDGFENAVLVARSAAFRILSADGDVFDSLRRLCATAKRIQPLLDCEQYDEICRICAENTQSADNEPSFPGLSDDMIKMMGTLESISPEWDAMLEKISRYNGGYSFDDETNIHINEELKQAAQYFVFRHFTEACDDGEIISKAYFAHFGCAVIYASWCAAGCGSFRERTDAAKLFSKQFEYSEENMGAVYDFLYDTYAEM